MLPNDCIIFTWKHFYVKNQLYNCFASLPYSTIYNTARLIINILKTRPDLINNTFLEMASNRLAVSIQPIRIHAKYMEALNNILSY